MTRVVGAERVHRHVRTAVAAGAALILLTIASPTAGAVSRTRIRTHIADLGRLASTTSYAFAINDAGPIVGVSSTSSGEQHAFLLDRHRMRDLGTSGHAFVTRGRELLDLGTLNGGRESFAAANNDRGDVVGYSDKGRGVFHATLWTR